MPINSNNLPIWDFQMKNLILIYSKSMEAKFILSLKNYLLINKNLIYSKAVFIHLFWLYRCRWRMLETKCVGDNFKMLVTVFAISFTHILYLLTLASGTNIQKMSPRSKFCRQNSKIVTNYKSPTSQCHQHACSHLFWILLGKKYWHKLCLFKLSFRFDFRLEALLPVKKSTKNTDSNLKEDEIIEMDQLRKKYWKELQEIHNFSFNHKFFHCLTTLIRKIFQNSL